MGLRRDTQSAPTTPQAKITGGSSRPRTPVSPSYSASSYSAFAGSPSTKLQPIHLSTVGRRELVHWVNEVLDLDLADIAEANNGAVACQLLDRMNPVQDVVNMRRVDFNARAPYYIEKNWRILQHAFVQLEIDWTVDVERCQHGHQLDLLLLFRLFYQRYQAWEEELQARGEQLPPYDAKARRALSKTGDIRDVLAPSPVGSTPSRSTTPKGLHSSRSSKGRLGDDDSAQEYNTRARFADSGTQMGASFKKGQKKPSIWQKLKNAIKS